MVVADTSVWVSALRDASTAEAITLRRLLDQGRVALAAPVKIEILGGSRRFDLPRLRRVLSSLPCWLPDEATWRLLELWVDTTVRAGERFGVTDLLIGAIAEQRGGEVWSLDRDFDRLARLDLLRLHRR
jgi:predicted nucleic acid-binding protein